MNQIKNKYQIKAKLQFAIYAMLSAFLFSCGEVEFENKKRVVKAKAESLELGTTKYLIAFENGESEKVSFGIYSKYRISDTICFQREKGMFWYVIDCR